MATFTRTNGGVGVEGVINGASGAQLGASLKFYVITVKNAAAAARDLRPEMAAGQNGGANLAVEAIMRVVPQGVLAYNVVNDNTGVIHLIVDGVNAPEATTGSTTAPGLQEMIRALGTTVGTNNMDVSGTTVADGATFTVA
jgi:hypothetical protein